ncbi:MAG TPA: sensor histidine kinase [Streptosporangiaceae bacterium]|nr:sensor histidine kinase [Streptosporangiaceae bacterium]
MSSGTRPLNRTGSRGWIRTGATAARRGLGFGALMLAGLALLLVLAAPFLLAAFAVARLVLRRAGQQVFAVAAPGPGGGVIHSSPGTVGQWLPRQLLVSGLVLVAATVVWLLLAPAILLLIRQLTIQTRRLSAEWCGIRIADPYRPARPGDREVSIGGFGRRLADPATRHDIGWLAVNACGGWVVAILPAGLIAAGLVGFLRVLTHHPQGGFLASWHSPLPLLAVSGGLIASGLAIAPAMLAGYAMLARWMLGPAGQAELVQRVQHLAETRSEAIDTGAAEMRRIERDLHDGAQARLVAMGMTLDAAGQLIESNPAAARALLLEARDTSVKALAELRDLVRGIHPPVLADRGLGDAVRALALDSPLRARLASDLPGRLPAPVESAAYFAVSELLANVSKHAGAAQAWIDIRYQDGMLRVGVSDDGRGGADPAQGTGLRGIERRVAAFDGVLAVHSPSGGPTAVTMEIPCALSSLKTSSC